MYKKIFLTLIFLFTFFFFPSNILASTNHIKLGDPIPNIKLFLRTPRFPEGKKKDMFEIKDSTTDELVYCIEPGIPLEEGDFEVYYDIRDVGINVTESDWDYITKAAYFGYGHSDRTDLKWYVATQFLIWDYLLEDIGEVYFIDPLTEEPITKYEEELSTLKTDIATANITPDFGAIDYNVLYNETLSLTDSNQVLDRFRLSYDNRSINADANGNTLNLSFNKTGSYRIDIVYNLDTNKHPLIFYDGKTQAVMRRGYFSFTNTYIDLNIRNPQVTAKKESSTSIPLSLKGAEYNLYYESDLTNVYRTFTTNKKGEFLMEDLEPNNYCLKETKAPYGYKLNPEYICFNVTSDTQIKLPEDPYLITVNFEKYLANLSGDYNLEPNAEFELYNEDTNELITTFKTNEFGKFSLQLWVGNYLLKQTKGSEGYNLMPDFKFTLTPDSAEYLNFTLKNKEIIGSLKLYKKDFDTKELITEPVAFKIKNLTTNQYLTISGMDTFHLTNGVLELSKIPYGTYLLEEVEIPPNYELSSNEPITFNITKEGEQVELTIYNTLMKGSLTLEKRDKETDELIPSQVTFKIKNTTTNEYLSLNGTTLFELTDGLLTLDNIPFGTYSLEEITPPQGYKILEEPLTFTISKENLEVKLTVYNYPLMGSLTIEKQDELTKEPLSGVHFGLYNADKELIGEYITNEEGLITIDNLKVGNYYLKELLTLTDYELNSEEIPIEIKDGIKTTILLNNRHLITVPLTSLNAYHKISMLSLFLFLVSLLIFKYAKKLS